MSNDINSWHMNFHNAVHSIALKKFTQATAITMIEMSKEYKKMPPLEFIDKNGKKIKIDPVELGDKIKVDVSANGKHAVISMEDDIADMKARALAANRLNSNPFDKMYIKLQHPGWLEKMIQRLDD